MTEKKTLSPAQLDQICRGLALLLHAGIGLNHGLFLLADDRQGWEKDILLQMGEKLDQGVDLATAAEESGAFPAQSVGMLRMGQNSGRLEQSLNALARYYQQKLRLQQALKNAVTYPGILLLLILVVVGVLLVKVLPIFHDVYASLGGQLTGLAGVLLRVGKGLKAALPVLCILLLVLLAAGLLLFFVPALRQRILDPLRRLWEDKGVWKKMNNARFARAMELGLGSGLPAEEAAELAASLFDKDSSPAARCMESARLLRQGESLNKALGDTELLPPVYCRMLQLGLQGGSGDEVMSEIADRMEEDALQAMDNTVSRIEPTMVLAAGVLVGGILFSVMVPLLHIMTAIG